MIIFGPILYQPGWGGFESLKITLLLIISAGLLIAFLNKSSTKLTIRRPKSSLVLLFLILYIVASNVWVSAPNLAWLGSEIAHLGIITWLGWFILAFIALNSSFTKTGKQLLLMAAIISLVGLIITVVGQWLNLSSLNWYSFDDPSRGRGLIGSIGASNLLGSTLAIWLIILQSNWQFIANSTVKRMVTVLLITGALIIVVSKSITGIAVLVLAELLILTQTKSKIIGFKNWFTLAIIAALLPFIVLLINRPLQNQNILPSVQDRAAIWQAGLTGFKDNYLLGVGVGQYQFVYDQYFPNNRSNTLVVTEENPHSLVVAWLVEWGLIGTLLWVLFIYLVWRESDFTKAGAGWLTILLVVQFNYLIATWLIATLLLFLLTSSPIPELKKELILNKVWLAACYILGSVWLAVTILAGNSYFQAAWRDSRAGDTTATLNFTKASYEYGRAVGFPLAASFTRLQFAENYTNLAIQNDNFSDYEPVRKNIEAVFSGAPTARNLNIAIAITSVWSENNSVSAQKQLLEIGRFFLKNYGQHPRYQLLVQELKKAGF